MQDHQDPHGRARLRNTIDAGKEPRYLWLLPVALLTLGLGGYTQLDKLRALLKPTPTAEAPRVPAPVAPLPVPAIAAPVPTQQTRRIEPPPAPPPPPAASPRRIENPSALLGGAPQPRTTPAPAAPPAVPAPARRSGQAGLVEALRNGEIRPGTAGDIGLWKSSYTRATGRGLGRAFDERTDYMEVYVVQKAFEVPDDLAGANAVVFVVETRTPFPSGDPGHSPILDTASGACVGMICRMLLTDE